MDSEPGVERARPTEARDGARRGHLRLVRIHEREGEPSPSSSPSPSSPERRPPAAVGLIALNVAEGIGGLVGAVMMFVHPHGTVAWPLSWLDRFPFHTFVVPGLVLATFLGTAPLVVAYGLWRRPTWRWTHPLVGWTHEHWSWAGAVLVAVAVLLWMLIELTLTPIRSAGLQIGVGAMGVAMAIMVAMPGVRRWYADR